jgi:hypothetical protein
MWSSRNYTIKFLILTIDMPSIESENLYFFRLPHIFIYWNTTKNRKAKYIIY